MKKTTWPANSLLKISQATTSIERHTAQNRQGIMRTYWEAPVFHIFCSKNLADNQLIRWINKLGLAPFLPAAVGLRSALVPSEKHWAFALPFEWLLLCARLTEVSWTDPKARLVLYSHVKLMATGSIPQIPQTVENWYKLMNATLSKVLIWVHLTPLYTKHKWYHLSSRRPDRCFLYVPLASTLRVDWICLFFEGHIIWAPSTVLVRQDRVKRFKTLGFG